MVFGMKVIVWHFFGPFYGVGVKAHSTVWRFLKVLAQLLSTLWGQISEIWSRMTLPGPKIFVWPFSRMGWPLPRNRSDHPRSYL